MVICNQNVEWNTSLNVLENGQKKIDAITQRMLICFLHFGELCMFTLCSVNRLAGKLTIICFVLK